jgi:hypothetical protein
MFGWVRKWREARDNQRAIESKLDELEPELQKLLAFLKDKGIVPAEVGELTIEAAGAQERTDSEDRARITSWKSWKFTMGELKPREGWAACRFANRLGPTDKIGWVYGVARGAFGVWCQPFPCCIETPGEDPHHDTLILAAITHIPTGMGLGLFRDADTACCAAIIIEGLEEWRNAPPLDADDETNRSRQIWNDMMTKAVATWKFNGIGQAMALHAHNGPNGDRLNVWMAGSVEEQPQQGKMS